MQVAAWPAGRAVAGQDIHIADDTSHEAPDRSHREHASEKKQGALANRAVTF